MKESVSTYLFQVLGIVLAIFAPIKATLILVFFLCSFDMILGIWSAKKRGHRINSRTMARTPAKLVVWFLLIGITFLMEKYLASEFGIVSKGVLLLCGIIEGQSICENLYLLTGVDFLKTVINMFQIQRKNAKFGGDEENEKRK
jgi:hypothetical protein